MYATVDTPANAEKAAKTTAEAMRTAAREAQAEADVFIQEQARRLAGKEVLFVGAGAAYRYYRTMFASCRPRAILVERRFMPIGNAEPIDGIPLVALEETPHDWAGLPILVFARDEFVFFLKNTIREIFPTKAQEEILPCVLYG